MTSSGSFSGKLTIGGKTFALGGRLDYLGHIKLPVLRRPIKPVVVTLNLNLSGRNQISGEVTDGEWISGLLAKKALATDEAVKRIKQANGAFSFQPIDSSSAEGVIIERASVSSSGTLKFRMLKSGNVFYPTSCLSDDNSAPIYFLSGNEPIPIVGEAKLAE